MPSLNRAARRRCHHGAVHIGAAPARADFCLEANNAPDGHFFRFKKSYPGKLKPGKLLPLSGKVLHSTTAAWSASAPAYGQLLGLPEDLAGFQLGIYSHTAPPSPAALPSPSTTTGARREGERSTSSRRRLWA